LATIPRAENPGDRAEQDGGERPHSMAIDRHVGSPAALPREFQAEHEVQEDAHFPTNMDNFLGEALRE
jgi:hypothetical protein